MTVTAAQQMTQATPNTREVMDGSVTLATKPRKHETSYFLVPENDLHGLEARGGFVRRQEQPPQQIPIEPEQREGAGHLIAQRFAALLEARVAFARQVFA